MTCENNDSSISQLQTGGNAAAAAAAVDTITTDLTKREDAHHVHFSPQPKIRRFPLQSKAWTDQAAPEPFSTPKSRQRKLGYGDFLKKNSDRGDANRITYPNSYHGGKSSSNHVFRRSSSYGENAAISNTANGQTILQRGTSFTQQDFPCLSPVKQQSIPARMTSWSSVAGVSSRSMQIDHYPESDLHTSEQAALDTIPPPPLTNAPPPPFAKTQVSFRDEPIDKEARQENELSQSFPPDFQDSLLQRSASLPFSSNYHHPFDTFTTMSRSCLQNDIGTLLARYNREDEAIERYEQSIEVATVDRDGLKAALEHLSSSTSEVGTASTTSPTQRKTKCPKVTEAEGLAWFHQKLLKGDVAAAAVTPSRLDSVRDSSSLNNHHFQKQTSEPPFQPAGFGGLVAPVSPMQRMRSASFGVDAMTSLTSKSFDHPKPPLKNSMVLTCPVTAPYPAKQHAVLPGFKRSHSSNMPQQFTIKPPVQDDRPHTKPVALVDDMEIYSCGGLTPLGLEYIGDPLPVLGTALRKLVTEYLAEDELSDFGTIDNICEASVTKRRKRMVAALLMDSAALIASKFNLASLRYRRADDLDTVLSILQQALEDFVHVRHIIESDRLYIELLCHNNFMDVFGLLEIVGHLNVGTVLYRLNRVRDAKSSFECAKGKLEKKIVLDEAHLNNFESGTNSSMHSSEHHPHDDNRLPSNDYMLLVIRASISRTLLRLSDHSGAEEICKLIADDNKPYRRNSARIFHRSTSHAVGAGYTRSDSFSVTTSAVDMAATAYKHNLERRYKWLSSVAEHYLIGMIHEAREKTDDYKSAMTYYNRLLSETRKKFDHRHPFICSLLERRGAVLFEQRKLQCSMLSYLACLKILEHQQFTQNKAFDEADMARVLYAVARVLHDKEDYHDALHMYQRALVWQRSLAGDKPSLNVITTLCNISRVHHLSGEIDEALATNQEVLQLAAKLVGGKLDHPFLIHRLKVEGNILIEAGRLEDAMNTFIDAARRCCEDGQNRMITTLMGGGSSSGNAQEDANAGDSSVLSMRSAAALAHIAFLHPAAPAG
ncbi:hypothetical protein ACHAWO_004811 [Cyclotella atomus]|uniref:Uncharacterized protein n=1 Tax=Cyclotella atomus TaxID=382360 RepID=A0ABD3PQT4_9STRA